MKPIDNCVSHEERPKGSDEREDVVVEAHVAHGDGLGNSEFVGGADALVHVEERPEQRCVKGRRIDRGKVVGRSGGVYHFECCFVAFHSNLKLLPTGAIDATGTGTDAFFTSVRPLLISVRSSALIENDA